MAGRFSVDAVFKAIDRMTRPIAKMQRGIDRFARTTTRRVVAVDRAMSRVAGTMGRVGFGAAAGATAAGFALNKLIQSGADFQQGMANVAAVSGASDAALAALTARAKELGATTQFTGTQVAGAMESMARSGYTAEQIITGVGGILSAAAADGADLESTAEAVMKAMKGLGLGPERMQGFADMMAKASASTASSIGSISESMKNFGPVARQLGVPVESAIAQLALLQDAGLDASQAGTALAASYSKLAAPVGATQKALQRLGIAVAATAGNMKAPDLLLSEILRSTDGITGNVGKMAAISQLVGLESQKALLNIAAAAKDGKLDALTKDLASAAGFADQLAKKRMNTFRGDMLLLESAIDGVKVALFEAESGPLRDLVQRMTKWVEANKDLIKSKVVDFIDRAIPVITNFASGVAQGFREVMPIVRGAANVLGKLFGDGTGAKNAQSWGRNITRLVFAFGGLYLGVKAARGITLAYEGVVWLASAAKWAYGAATTFATGATWRHVAATVASAGASVKGAAANVIASKSLIGVAKFAGAAAAAIGGIALAWDQWQSLQKESGGLGPLGFVKKAWELGTLDPAKIVDAHMSEQARAAAKAAKAVPKVDPLASFDFTAAGMAGGDALAKQMMSGLDFSQLGGAGGDAFMSSVMQQSTALEKQLASLPSFRVEHHMMGPAIRGLDAGVAEDGSKPHRPQVVSTTAERIAREIRETSHTEHAEVTLRDETGRAAITKPPKGKAVGLRLQRTGTP